MMEIFLSMHLDILTCPNILDPLDCFVRHAWCALSVYFCDENILGQSDCFVRHAWFALSVFFCDGKTLHKAVGILRSPKYY